MSVSFRAPVRIRTSPNWRGPLLAKGVGLIASAQAHTVLVFSIRSFAPRISQIECVPAAALDEVILVTRRPHRAIVRNASHLNLELQLRLLLLVCFFLFILHEGL
jgi:hypothetical protein